MNENTQLGEVSHDSGGFEIIQFKDHHEANCCLRMSSLCLGYSPGESAVELGRVDASPQIIYYNAARLGVKTNQKCGWVPYPLPKEVQISTKMYLDREQAAALVSHLQAWLENGTFELSNENED